MKIAFIGFGEAAQSFVKSLQDAGLLSFSAYDIKYGTEAGDALQASANTLGVAFAASPEEAVRQADWVLSAVTAASCLEAAQSVAEHMVSGQTFVDVNSVSAKRKQQAAELITANGARYVDMAIMAPVAKKAHRTTTLVAGPLDKAFLEKLKSLDFNFNIAGDTVGAATSIKMVRSLFVKGLEAITVQALLAAKQADCYDEILESISSSYPALGWPDFAAYQMERVATHGIRRADEMRECAASMDDLGFVGGTALASAIADVQQEIANLDCDISSDAELAVSVETLLSKRD